MRGPGRISGQPQPLIQHPSQRWLPAACGSHFRPFKVLAKPAGGSGARSWISQATTLHLSFTLHLPFTDQPLVHEVLVLSLGHHGRMLTS